jgi:hypothetical protein
LENRSLKMHKKSTRLHPLTMLISVCSFLSYLSLCLNCLSSLCRSLYILILPLSFFHTICFLFIYAFYIYLSSWIAHPFEMGPIDSPETSVSNYQSTLRNIPEEQSSYFLLFASEFSCTCFFLFLVFSLSLNFLILFS